MSSHVRPCHTCHGICTLSPLDAALTTDFAKNTQHDSSKVLRLPRKMKMDTSKVLRLPSKKSTRLLKTMRKYCPCHTERLSTLCETCWNVTKCHACHTKRRCATFETSKSDHFCHSAFTTVVLRTSANGCERQPAASSKHVPTRKNRNRVTEDCKGVKALAVTICLGISPLGFMFGV